MTKVIFHYNKTKTKQCTVRSTYTVLVHMIENSVILWISLYAICLCLSGGEKQNNSDITKEQNGAAIEYSMIVK